MADTLIDLLAAGADDAPALAAPGAPALGHGALRRHVRAVAGSLARHGIGRRDRVAVVLPNGPAMASAFLAVAAAAVAAPLNPAYRADEFDFYLGDLDARALVLPAGAGGPAREVAARRGIPVYELSEDAGAAGLFSLSGPAVGGAVPAGRRRPATPHSSCTRRGPRRGRRSYRSRTPISPRRRAISAPPSVSDPATAASTSCRCSTFTA